MKKYMMEAGVPYSTSCVLLCITSLWLALAALCLMEREKKPELTGGDGIHTGGDGIHHGSSVPVDSVYLDHPQPVGEQV